MQIINDISQMQCISREAQKNGKKVACVPTMGYLHEGHASLIDRARENADLVIVTLFVNPTQFAPNEDFESYPRDVEHDTRVAESHGANYIFAPDVKKMYPIGYQSYVSVERVTQKFEGEKRPSHFRGVATVVAKLFNATLPQVAVFGRKDYQQTLVIKQMVRDLNFPIEIIIAPTIRESDGLAMSSRNKYLSQGDRAKSSILFLAIEDARHAIESGELSRVAINSIMLRTLRSVPEIKIDYIAAADAETLDEPEIFLPGESIVLLLACYLGKTRLIDNAVVTIPNQLNEKNFIEGI